MSGVQNNHRFINRYDKSPTIMQFLKKKLYSLLNIQTLLSTCAEIFDSVQELVSTHLVSTKYPTMNMLHY